MALAQPGLAGIKSATKIMDMPAVENLLLGTPLIHMFLKILTFATNLR